MGIVKTDKEIKTLKKRTGQEGLTLIRVDFLGIRFVFGRGG